MTLCISPHTARRITIRQSGRTMLKLAFLLTLTVALNAGLLFGQARDTSANADGTVQILLQRIDQMEARIAQLEAASKQGAASVVPPTAPVATPPEPEPESRERMDLSKTLLRIRGFGDVTFHGDNHKGDTTSFALGQLNLFITSDLSDKFKFLGEVVFEAGPNNQFGFATGTSNAFGVDIERLLLQYSHSDYFNLAVGRYHTAIGYYNTAYHHSTWLQTTLGRPLLFDFEDSGGPLPIHNVGVSASGMIPSGALGLHYVAEVGNGRRSRSPLDEQVQNVVDENTHKALNLAIFARPDSVRGLQTGVSVYRDLLTPNGKPAVQETIVAAHAVFTRPKFEWLNEAMVIRHAPRGQLRAFNTPGFYSQISKQFRHYRPYFRYEYLNVADAEPIFPDIGLQAGPSVGVRFDASDFVALKLQYDYRTLRRQPATQSLGLQAAFTF